LSDDNYTILPKGCALWTPGMLGAALLAFQRRKGMKAKDRRRASQFQRRRTLRLSDYEDARLVNQAAAAGLSVSEYMRRRFFGGRPIVAHADAWMIRELRRLGGLLKYNFETLRQAGASRELLCRQENLLAEIAKAINRIGT
jgi:hypothetical protein